ncbi:MAG: hypothetical protein ABIR79_13365 [Candidatus Binatia bacterium]
MQNRDEMLDAIRAEDEARPLQDGPYGSTLSFDGCRHYLTPVGGAWEIRFELEQLGAGEVIGVGSVWTAARPGEPLRPWEVLVSGRVDERGMATLALVPVAATARSPVRLLVRMAGRSDGQDPIVSEVLDVQGLPP